MIRWNLAPLMKRHRLENANQLAVFAKIPPPLAYRLVSSEPVLQINTETLQALARAFRVKPWTLLEWIPDE